VSSSPSRRKIFIIAIRRFGCNVVPWIEIFMNCKKAIIASEVGCTPACGINSHLQTIKRSLIILETKLTDGRY